MMEFQPKMEMAIPAAMAPCVGRRTTVYAEEALQHPLSEGSEMSDLKGKYEASGGQESVF